MLLEPQVSGCVVLYHSGAKAEETVRCFLASTMPVRLYVVDHSPEDVIGRMLARGYENRLEVITPEKNRGCGAGHNVVLNHLKSAYHVVCNPDVRFDPQLLERMAAFMNAHKDIAILTPRVMNPDGTEQLLPRREPRLRYLLARRLPGLRGPFERWRNEYTMADAPEHGVYSVQFATGCFMMIRTSVLYRLKGFDERFFLYHEDSDLSRRVQQYGKIVYHRDFAVVHDWTRGSMHSRKALMHHIRSTVKYFNKWGWRW